MNTVHIIPVPPESFRNETHCGHNLLSLEFHFLLAVFGTRVILSGLDIERTAHLGSGLDSVNVIFFAFTEQVQVEVDQQDVYKRQMPHVFGLSCYFSTVI